MKALSIRQPWAWLIVNGIKPIENRTWQTNYRGRFFVHASEKFDMPKCSYAAFRHELMTGFAQDGIDIDLPEDPEDFQTGGIVGTVDLIDCVTECDDEYEQAWHIPGNFAFILDNPEPLPFRPLKGKLNFFEVS